MSERGSAETVHSGTRLAKLSGPFGLVCVGNELLSGKISDLNLHYWIRELSALGRKITAGLLVPDEPSLICDAIRYVRERCEVVLLSGGIGPTHDDMTLPSVARALGRKLTRDERLLSAIEAHYGEATNESLRRMADLPEGSELLFWETLPVPLYYVDGIYIFPGSPDLMRAKFELLKQSIVLDPIYEHRFYTSFDEAKIAELMAEIEARHPGLAIGSYPRYDPLADYSVLITLETRSPDLLRAALRGFDLDWFRGGVLRETSGRPDDDSKRLGQSP